MATGLSFSCGCVSVGSLCTRPGGLLEPAGLWALCRAASSLSHCYITMSQTVLAVDWFVRSCYSLRTPQSGEPLQPWPPAFSALLGMQFCAGGRGVGWAHRTHSVTLQMTPCSDGFLDNSADLPTQLLIFLTSPYLFTRIQKTQQCRSSGLTDLFWVN